MQPAELLDAITRNSARLAEAAAELELTREQEDAVRRIAVETTDEFFKLLTDKDQTVDDVRREFEDAKKEAIYLLRPYIAESSEATVRTSAGAALRRLIGQLPTKRQAVRLPGGARGEP